MAGNNSSAVLRNKGVSIEVYETDGVPTVDEDGSIRMAWSRRTDGERPVVATEWVRFDGNSLADLEEAFGDLGKFQEATTHTPFTTVRRALAIVLGWDDTHPRRPDGTLDPSGKRCPGCSRAGLAMKEGGAMDYATAMVAALSLANGLDPTRVQKMLKVGVKAAADAKAQRMDVLDKMFADGEAGETPPPASTSTDGSTPGSPLVEATTSSGG